MSRPKNVLREAMEAATGKNILNSQRLFTREFMIQLYLCKDDASRRILLGISK